MTYPQFCLKCLRDTEGGSSVYDEASQTGVNIIWGENGSGMSKVADFLFYALDREFR